MRRRAGIERELASEADQRVFRFFGHVELINEYRMARKVLMAEVRGGWLRGRPRISWIDGVKVALGNRGSSYGGDCATIAKDTKEWRALVHM